MKLPRFNIVRSAFCTCLPKYNINPYLGRCTHGCIYCYAVKFPSFRGELKPRLDLKEKIEMMVANTKVKLPVMMSDSTDPYQPPEKKYEITRKCLEVLTEHNFPVLIVTKSNLVVRDIDLLKRTPSVVSVTITTPRKKLSRLLEPNAPSPEERFGALEEISGEGLPTVLRIDPIIPTLNSKLEDLELLVKRAAEAGVKQITASTMKPVKGFFKRFQKLVDEETYRKVYSAYSGGIWISGYKYLRKELRARILRNLKAIALSYGLEFATCREGIPDLNTTVCDGTAYCRSLIEKYM
ncbi:radical SAM protein [Candidatus Bathyarchaeota archaeon]|nr:MAG: radical SAM protein [Candidatus Bathyarchaeota archaeon]